MASISGLLDRRRLELIMVQNMVALQAVPGSTTSHYRLDCSPQRYLARSLEVYGANQIESKAANSTREEPYNGDRRSVRSEAALP